MRSIYLTSHHLSEYMLVTDIDDTIKEIRSTIYRMRTPLGPGSSLRDRVLQVLSELAPTLGHEPASTFTGPLDVMVTEDLVDDVVAVLRASLTGVARHSAADTTGVCLAVLTDRRELHVTVTDNGTAWNESARERDLAGIRARAEERGGRFVIESTVDQVRGTRVLWIVPTP